MTRTMWVGCVMAVCVAAGLCAADEVKHPMPQPQKEHQWLQQIVGEWTAEGECAAQPSADATAPPAKFKGTESGRLVGGFWAVLENKGEFMGAPFTGILTLGYDPETKKYVGTWVDSMTPRLWHYEGTVDATGKVLTLQSEGPCPKEPGKILKFRETIELKGKDHKVFTSMIEQDGKWTPLMTIQYRRKA